MNISDITDNKKFWKTVKPILSDKGRSNSKITLIEDEKIISNDEEVAETLNNYFVTSTDSLGITENSDIISSTEGASDPIVKARLKYSNHPSIRKIRNFVQNAEPFKFQKVSLEQMDNEIRRLTPKKATTFKIYLRKSLKAILTFALNRCNSFSIIALKMVCFPIR